MSKEHRKILAFFTVRRIMIPILIGLAVAVFLFLRDFDRGIYSTIKWNPQSTFWLFSAIVLMAVRDFSYIFRIRLLTDWQFGWLQSFQVIMLWEFASSITPSMVGGSAIALYIVKKEGINMGRTTAIVMITAMLDEIFYILMVPLVILLAGSENLFVTEGKFLFFNADFGSKGIFLIGYGFIVMLTCIITFGIFINPRWVKRFLIWAARFRVFRRWSKFAGRTGDEIITTSREMKGKPFIFWVKAFGATFFSWTARFWVVNCLILAFTGTVSNHFMVYARQLIMWVILLISPTPGSTGTAEYFFPLFLGDFTYNLSSVVAVTWRLVSYYPYIFIGMIILPAWIRRVYFGRRRMIKFRQM